jgi:hypothetical protein
VVTCGLSLVVGAVACIGRVFSRDPESRNALLFVGPIFLALAVFFFLPGFIGSLGLLRGRAWPRTVIIVLSFLVILLFPVGTALGAFGLWVLRGQDSRQFPSRARSKHAAEEAVPPVAPSMSSSSAHDTEPNADPVGRIRSRMSDLARLIQAPDHMLPTFGYSEETRRPHIELAGTTFHYVVSDRGREFERFSTTSADDPLYRVFRDATFSMAAASLRVSRVTRGARRQILRQQLTLLGQLDPRWASRREAER